jgi:hypothetical protein
MLPCRYATNRMSQGQKPSSAETKCVAQSHSQGRTGTYPSQTCFTQSEQKRGIVTGTTDG